MAHAPEIEALNKTFSGLGVDEKALITILGKWKHEHKHTFRKGTPHMFVPDERQFEKWIEEEVARLKHEALRFKSAVVLWVMHPWERDARLLKEAIGKGPVGYNLIIEIACTRSSEQLLGARKAYHSLFDHSVEEDVASHVTAPERKLLVALVSSYRYEGPRVNEEIVKSEANILHNAIKKPDDILPVEDDEVVRILSTRSKPHIISIFKHYIMLHRKHLDEDIQGVLNKSLKVAVQCLCAPETYFSETLNAALQKGADDFTQEALTQVIISQVDEKLKDIKTTYHKKFGVDLSKNIEETTRGNFKDFLLTLLARAE